MNARAPHAPATDLQIARSATGALCRRGDHLVAPAFLRKDEQVLAGFELNVDRRFDEKERSLGSLPHRAIQRSVTSTPPGSPRTVLEAAAPLSSRPLHGERTWVALNSLLVTAGRQAGRPGRVSPLCSLTTVLDSSARGPSERLELGRFGGIVWISGLKPLSKDAFEFRPVARAVYIHELADARRRTMRRSRMIAEYSDLLKP